VKADIIALQETWCPDGAVDPVVTAAQAIGFEAVQHTLLAGTTLHHLEVGIPDRSTIGSFGLALLTTLPLIGVETVDLGMAPGDVVRRSAQVVTVALPGGRALRLANAHLTHRVFASPIQLGRLAGKLSAAPQPAVIIGDLNTLWPLTSIASGYRRAVRGRTWLAHRRVLQLDHILVDRRVGCADGEVLDHVGSDHRPIRTRLYLP
jgi:endonuclease/exonuclease/phosphatase family metal-dependent hydrolase